MITIKFRDRLSKLAKSNPGKLPLHHKKKLGSLLQVQWTRFWVNFLNFWLDFYGRKSSSSLTVAKLSKVEKGHKITWSCNIYEFEENDENQELKPIDSIEYDNLLNCVWRPEDSLPEAIMLVSSTGLSIYENGNLTKIAEKQRFCWNS